MVSRTGFMLFLALVATASFLTITIWSEEVEGRTVIHGDVVVDHDLTWYGDTFEVHGNVTVEGGMHLQVIQATVEIVGAHNGSHWFNASAGSTLTLDNATIRGSPHPVGIVLAGTGHMVDSSIEGAWTSNMTPAIDLSGAMTMLMSTIQGVPDSTGMLVTGSLEAESCTFQDMGDLSMRFHDPTIPGRSSLRNCTFTAPASPAGDTIGVSIWLTEALAHRVDLTVVGCAFDGFTYGVEAFVNSTTVNLTVSGSDFLGCSTGLTISGNQGRVAVTGCAFDGSATVGLSIYVVDPLLRPLNLTVEDVTSTSAGTGIFVRGPLLNFRPVLRRVNVSGCDHGIQALGATVLVEDSVVLDCTVCFYVEHKARIEIRRTEHTYRSADIAPAQQAAVVAFSTVEISSCWWWGAHRMTQGTLFLHGDDGVELKRVDMGDLGRMELVVWSLTRFNDLGRLWVVPSIRQDGHEFVGHNFSIYNSTPQDLQIVDDQAPVLFDLWPADGHWFAYDRVNVTGRLVENGSGLDSLTVRVSGGQEVTVDVPPDGNWSAVFGPVTEGLLTVELVARDLTGLTTVMNITGLTVDITDPTIRIDHNFTTLTNGSLLIPANDITLTGVTEPHSTVVAVVLGMEDTPYKCNETVEADEEGAFQVQLCPGRGYHTISITSTDRAGNVGSVEFDIAMDSIGPTVWITAPERGSDVWYNSTTVDVVASVGDTGASEWVKVWLNGEEVEAPNGDLVTTLEVAEGETEIMVRAQDQAGLISFAVVTVRVDATAPDLRLVAPAETVFSTKDVKVDLQGELFEEHLAGLTLNGVPLNHLDGLFTAVLNLGEGENTYVITATDLAGNSATRRLVITKDVTPPVYTLSATVPGGTLLQLDGRTYATAPGVGDVLLTLTFSVSERTEFSVSGVIGTVEGEGEVDLQLDLAEGENTFNINLVDMAGNSASTLVYRVTLDTTPPEIDVPGSATPQTTKDSTHWLRGTVETGAALTLDGEPLRVNADGTFSTQVDLSKGENTFHLEAIDVVGQEATLDVVIIREAKEEDSPGPAAPMVAMALTLALLARGVRGRRGA